MTTPGSRDERGLSTIDVLLGAFVGSLIIGSLMLFYFSAGDSTDSAVTRADREADAVKVLNRAGRDIADAVRVVSGDDQQVVVTQGPGRKVRYAIEADPADATQSVLVKQVDDGSGFGAKQVLGRDVVPGTAGTHFTYWDEDGDEVAPAQADLVDITYIANTRAGTVEVKSAAAVDTATGGTTVGGDGAGDPPIAADLTVPLDCAKRGSGDLGAAVAGEASDAGYTIDASASGLVITGPDATGQFEVDATTMTAPGLPGTVAVGTYTATDRDGSDTATLSLSWDGAPCELDAYPIAAPAAPDATTGQTQVEWTGGPIALRKASGPAGAAQVLSGDLDSREGTAVLRVPLGSVFEFGRDADNNEVIDSSATIETATQFPAPQTVTTEGSENDTRLGDGTLDVSARKLTNTVKLTGYKALPPGSLQGVREYYSHRDPLTNDIVLDMENFEPHGDAQVGSSLDTATGWKDTGEDPGSESVYVPISFTPAAEDLEDNPALLDATAERGGERYFPSYSLRMEADELGQYYDDNPASRAYQAPARMVKTLSGGNPQGADCFAPNRQGEDQRLVPWHPSTPDNGIYSCNDGWATVQVEAYADTAARAADGSVVSGTGSAAFCEYDSNPGNCRLRVNLAGDAGRYPADASTESKAVLNVGVPQSGPATTDTYDVFSCNKGGCVRGSRTTDLHSFPGKFVIRGISQQWEHRYKNFTMWFEGKDANGNYCWDNNGCKDPLNHSVAKMEIRFNQSNGMTEAGGEYRLHSNKVSGTYSGARDWDSVDVGQTLLNPDNPDGWATSGPRPVSADTLYDVSVRANPRFPLASGVQDKMWRRTVSPGGNWAASVYTSPLPLAFVQGAAFCREASNDGWRYGYAFQRSVVDEAGQLRNGANHQIRYMWWVGRKNYSQPGSVIPHWSAVRWRAGDRFANASGNWPDPSNWAATWGWGDNQRGTEFWGNYSGESTTNGYTTNLVGANDRLLPPRESNTAGGVANMRLETFVTWEDAGRPEFGDLTYFSGDASGDKIGANESYNTADQSGYLLKEGGNWPEYAAAAGVGNETFQRADAAPTRDLVQSCGDTRASDYWSDGSGWKVVGGGVGITRRADPGGWTRHYKTPRDYPWQFPLP